MKEMYAIVHNKVELQNALEFGEGKGYFALAKITLLRIPQVIYYKHDGRMTCSRIEYFVGNELYCGYEDVSQIAQGNDVI